MHVRRQDCRVLRKRSGGPYRQKDNTRRGGGREEVHAFQNWPLDGRVRKLDRFKSSLVQGLESPSQKFGPSPVRIGETSIGLSHLLASISRIGITSRVYSISMTMVPGLLGGVASPVTCPARPVCGQAWSDSLCGHFPTWRCGR